MKDSASDTPNARPVSLAESILGLLGGLTPEAITESVTANLPENRYEWRDAFDDPYQGTCQCPLCTCLFEAEDGRICSRCYYDVHLFGKGAG